MSSKLGQLIELKLQDSYHKKLGGNGTREAKQLLKKYQGVFAKSSDGTTSIVNDSIDTGEAFPIRQASSMATCKTKGSGKLKVLGSVEITRS